MKEQIRILHINDLHSHFEAYPKIKRFFEAQRQTEAEVIALDLGDNVDKSHPLTEATSGQANVQLMNELGIDLATIGNNEGVGLSKAELNSLYDRADFQVVLGNLTDQSGRPSWAQPYHIYETKAGTRLAFLGATFPYYWTYEPNGWQIEDGIQALERQLAEPEVREADFRILLSHLGIRVDEAICHKLPAVDLIIGAHTHHVFEEGETVMGTYLAAAGRYGEYVGQIDLVFDNGQLEEIVIEAQPTSQISSQKTDAAFVEGLASQGRTMLAQEKIFNWQQPPTLQGSAALVLEAMRDYSGADLAMVNTGIVVRPFERSLTRASLHASLPHQMRLVTFELTSLELLAICQDVFSQAELLANQKIRGMGFRGERFGQMMTSGFAYKNGKIVYNGKVDKETEKKTLVLVDQYYFAPYFESLNQKNGKHRGDLLFPDLLRELVEKYLKGKA